MKERFCDSRVARRDVWGETKELSRLGFPVLITQLGVIIVSFADTMMVGRYGIDELAAAAFVNSFFMIPIVMLIGFASGLTPLAGAAFGRSDKKEIGKLLKGGLQINLLLAALLTLIMGVLYFFLDKFGQPAELLPLIRQYYLVILATMIPMAVFNSCQQVSNGLTDTSMPMWIMLGCNVLNIIGNYLLIFGKFGFPELGLYGAGLSTLFSRTVGAVLIFLIFAISKKRRDYWEAFLAKSNLKTLRRMIFNTSYPIMIQSGVECSLWTMGAVVCGWFGKIQLGAYQIVNTISQLGFMIYMSVGVATSVRVANFTGLRCWPELRMATRAGLYMNLLLGTLASLVFVFCGESLIALFTDDLSVIKAADALIIPLVLYQYGDAVQLTFANGLRGTSKVKPLLVVSVVSYMAIGLPLLLILGWCANLGNIGVYYSFSGALFSASILLYYYYNSAVKKLEGR